MLLIIYYGVYHLCYYLLLFMLDTLGPSAIISDLDLLCLHEYICVLGPIYELYAPIIVRTGDPNGDNLGHQRGWTIISGFHVSIDC